MQLAPLYALGHRAGFFLGDGAGVGKGRQIAGLVYQHYRAGGRRALWVGGLCAICECSLPTQALEKVPGFNPCERAYRRRSEKLVSNVAFKWFNVWSATPGCR
jgi:hypothetical protein